MVFVPTPELLEAKPGDWPSQAMLRTRTGYGYCGRTLVTPNWVVSAAHCLYGKSAGSVYVRYVLRDILL